MDEDLYPNDSSYFVPQEPADQSVARKKEKAHTLEALPILQDLVQRLQERIAYYNSVDSIPDEVKANPAEFMHLFSAYKLTKDTLIMEKEYLEGLIEEAMPQKR